MQLSLQIVLDRHRREVLAESVHLFFRERRHGRMFIDGKSSEDPGGSEVRDAVE